MSSKKGWLKKKGGAFGGSLQPRWFTLENGHLTYFKKEGDNQPQGSLDMRNANIVLKGKDLTIKGPEIKKKYELVADTEGDAGDWLAALEAAAAPKSAAAKPKPAAEPAAEKKKEPAAAPTTTTTTTAAAKPKPAAEPAAASSSGGGGGAAAPAAGGGGSSGAPGTGTAKVKRSDYKEVKPGCEVWVTKAVLEDGGTDFTVENKSTDSVLMKINLMATRYARPVFHGETKHEDDCAVIFLDPEESAHMLTLYKETPPPGEKESIRVGYMFTKDDPSDKFLAKQAERAKGKIEDQCAKIKSLVSDPTDLEAVAEACKKNKIMFVDLEMPPAKFNLPNFVWERPIDFLDPATDGIPVLFDDCIEPNDIFQGSLGDCWFMCALATMAEFPPVVRKCLPQAPLDDETGVHRMRICKDGWWKMVIVDDFFPCNFGRGPAYAKNKGAEMWSAIMEKAYAKLHGSYASMCTGLTGQALSELTGFPYMKFSIRTKDLDTEKLWSNLRLWDMSDFMMSAGTPGDDALEYAGEGSWAEADAEPLMTEEEYYNAGFITAHSYSVIDCADIKGNRLLKMRNPWGGLEWNGDWSDESDLWTDEIRDALKFEAADDGLFWMSFEDFLRYFVNVTVCFNHIHTTWRDIRSQGEFKNASPNFFVEAHFKKDSKAFVSISQKDKRSKDMNDPDYEYYELGFIILGPNADNKHDNYEVLEWTGWLKSRDVWVETHFKASDKPYLIVPITCCKDSKVFNFSLTAEQFDFGDISFRQYDPSLMHQAVKVGTFSRGKERVWSKENDCSIFCFYAGRFLGMLAVNRSQEKHWKVRITADTSKNYEPIGDDKSMVFELEVPKGSLRYVNTFHAMGSSYTFEYKIQHQFSLDGESEGNEGYHIPLNYQQMPKIELPCQVDGDKVDHQLKEMRSHIECKGPIPPPIAPEED